MQVKLVLLNKEGDLAARGDTYRHLAESLQNKGLVEINMEGRFWEWKKPLKTFRYDKVEESAELPAEYAQHEFCAEAAYDIVEFVCGKLGYNLYRHDPYM